MQEIILSICMPTYNRKNHISRQIKFFENEMVNLEPGTVEVIVSNNCSTDGTKEFLCAFENKYSWLKINNNETNIGAYSNMRKMLFMASGKYIWIPGDDDYLRKGIVNRVIEIIRNHYPSYIFLSRRTFIEETKAIGYEGKRHAVQYDVPFDVTHETLLELLKENYGDLKFQTSSIFVRETCLKYDSESVVFEQLAKEGCHSLFRAVRSMQDGVSFFVSDIEVLNGDETTWSDKIIEFLSIADAQFIEKLNDFGFSKQECDRISRRQLAVAYLFYLQNKELLKAWRKKGRPYFKFNQIPCALFLAFRKIKRVVWRSEQYVKAEVNLEDFM